MVFDFWNTEYQKNIYPVSSLLLLVSLEYPPKKLQDILTFFGEIAVKSWVFQELQFTVKQ